MYGSALFVLTVVMNHADITAHRMQQIQCCVTLQHDRTIPALSPNTAATVASVTATTTTLADVVSILLLCYHYICCKVPFLPVCMQCRRGLAMRILSVRLSNAWSEIADFQLVYAHTSSAIVPSEKKFN